MTDKRRNSVRRWAFLTQLTTICVVALALALPHGSTAQVVAFDMVGSTSLNLNSFTNPWNGAFGSAGDGFQKYQRGVSATIPFAVLDDSLTIFPSDSQGIIKEGNTDVFFGVVDTENPQNSGPVSATWEFDVSGATGLVLSIDMGAMGDFESSDFFEWTYWIDGGPTLTAFASSVDEAGTLTYTMDGGASFTLNDPMLVQGTVLSNDMAAYAAPLVGTGSTLTLTLTAQFNGGSEAVAFQNIILSEGDVPPPPPTELEIFEIQGNGAFSPVEGSVVTTRNNVVTCLGTNGFFIQTPTARTDNDLDTSDGIFVFTGGALTVAVGDLVDVTGEVDEFFGLTEFRGGSTVTVVGSGVPPTPVAFNATVPSADPDFPSCAIEFECYEGMLVEITGGTVTGPNQRFGPDPIAEVHITAAPARTFRELGILTPGLPGLPVWDGNPEVFELDPDKLGLPNLIIPAGSSFNATGVLGFEFGGYELWPNELEVTAAPLPVAVRPREAGEFTVGSLNMFRLFDDVDDPETFDAQGNPRDDAVVSSAEYLRRRLKLASYVLEVLDAPDVLAVQEVEKLGVLEALAAEIEAIAPGVVYEAFLEEGNDIGTIDIGFLVRDTVAVDAVTQLGKDETFFNPVDLTIDILHDRPPLLLEGRLLLEFGEVPMAVMTTHNRSLGGIDHPVDGPRVREKRLLQANSIAEKVQALQAADPEVRLMVIGDFNAFEFTDGYVDVMGRIAGDFDDDDDLVIDPTDLVDPDLSNQIFTLDAGQRYSFVFRGSAQALDHALTSQGLEVEVSGAQYGRGNADAAFDLINDGATPENIPLRSSDHDGLVVYLLNDEDADGVPNDLDVCAGTAIPEAVPTEQLGVNRWALVDGDGIFDTTLPPGGGQGPGLSFTVGDTAGCSCEQIIVGLGLGQGHVKFGCSSGAMQNWVTLVSP